jgi:non-haem Fe2+, alpha-ketoglutarate-dependent halogenase
MPKILTHAQIDQFREQGFVSPIRVMSAAEALGYRSRLERFEQETGGPLGGHLRHKTHLLFTWLADLVRHPAGGDWIRNFSSASILGRQFRGFDVRLS